MNLFQSEKSYDELIQHIRDCGYSEIYLSRIKREIRWLTKNKDAYGISSYREACLIREKQTKSTAMQQQQRAIYGLFRQYSCYGNLSSDKREPMVHHGAYMSLNVYFRNLLDIYDTVSKKRGLKKGTTRASISASSGFLLVMQKKNRDTLDDISEDDVLSYFTDENGNAILSSSTKVNIASVFEADLGFYTNAARRILSFLPALHRRRKNIQYLTLEEVSAVRTMLYNEISPLSLRNRAIGRILFFTGMRSGDIAGMLFSDIDWKKEEIRMIQAKTGNELLLPLTPIVGNAIYDYVKQERPQNKDEHIFLCEGAPFYPIHSQTVGHVANKIYETASIRQNLGDKKGAHLFRHNLATSFASQGIPRPVISATLGHSDPNSLDHYLYADITHLRECAISIEAYPIREEVFQW